MAELQIPEDFCHNDVKQKGKTSHAAPLRPGSGEKSLPAWVKGRRGANPGGVAR